MARFFARAQLLYFFGANDEESKQRIKSRNPFEPFALSTFTYGSVRAASSAYYHACVEVSVRVACLRKGGESPLGLGCVRVGPRSLHPQKGASLPASPGAYVFLPSVPAAVGEHGGQLQLASVLCTGIFFLSLKLYAIVAQADKRAFLYTVHGNVTRSR